MKGNIKVAVDKMTATVSTGNEEQKQTIKLDFKVNASIRDLARALYWQSLGYPLYIVIGTNQAEHDLKIESVDYQLALALVEVEPAGLKEADKILADKPVVEKTKVIAATAVAPGSIIEARITTTEDNGHKEASAIPPIGLKCLCCGYIPTSEELTAQIVDKKSCPKCGKELSPLAEIPAPEPKRRGRPKKEKLLDLSSLKIQIGQAGAEHEASLAGKVVRSSRLSDCIGKLFMEFGIRTDSPEALEAYLSKYPESPQKTDLIAALHRVEDFNPVNIGALIDQGT